MTLKALNSFGGHRYAGTSVIYRVTDPVLGAGVTLSIPAIDVNAWDSGRGRITADQNCTVRCWYGQDGDEDSTPTTTNIIAGESIPLEFAALEETLRIEIENTSASPMAALKFAIRARS